MNLIINDNQGVVNINIYNSTSSAQEIKVTKNSKSKKLKFDGDNEDEYIQEYFASKKIANLRIAEMYKENDMIDKARRLYSCWTFLEFWKTDTDLKLIMANSCRVRLCPGCAWRRSLKVFRNNKLIASEVEQRRKNPKYIHLVLTLRNVSGENLKEAIDTLFLGFNKMTRLKQIKESWSGYIRNFEVTYNEVEDTYHPHLHVYILVSPNYFSRNYITHAEYNKMWINATKINYYPHVHIKKVYSENAIAEVSKYALKYSDILNLSDEKLKEVIAVLEVALMNRRAVGYGFLWKEIHKELKIQDEISNEDYVQFLESEKSTDEGERILYRWIYGEYQRSIIE